MLIRATDEHRLHKFHTNRNQYSFRSRKRTIIPEGAGRRLMNRTTVAVVLPIFHSMHQELQNRARRHLVYARYAG